MIGSRSQGRPCASASNTSTASSRAKRGAADIVADIDAAEPQRPGLADHIRGEMLALVPIQRVRRHARRGEGFGHVSDGELILGELELAGAGIDGGVHGLLP